MVFLAIKFRQLAAVLVTVFAAVGIRSLAATGFTIILDDSGRATQEEGTLEVTKKKSESESESCKISQLNPSVLEDPCQLDESIKRAPDYFSLVFPTNYGRFTAECARARAPVWADRVYKLASNGYYNDNYFFRVIPGRYAQFGTNGNPKVSNVYNYTSASPSNLECSILDPQPPFMPYCMASKQNDNDCKGVSGLSNDFGTIAMSTSYNTELEEFPNGVTWNATAELFINIGENNQNLDSHLFVPICTVTRQEMETVVLKFPSFGEISELGGDGPSLGKLYEDGNAYIESNSDWKESMALTGVIEVCP